MPVKTENYSILATDYPCELIAATIRLTSAVNIKAILCIVLDPLFAEFDFGASL
jgi:hypothetical protein